MTNRVKELREAKGMSRAELAARMGVTTSVVCRLENHPDARFLPMTKNMAAAALTEAVETVFPPAAAVKKEDNGRPQVLFPDGRDTDDLFMLEQLAAATQSFVDELSSIIAQRYDSKPDGAPPQ